MRVNKLLRNVSSTEVIGLYTPDGDHIGNFNAYRIPEEYKNIKVKSVWSGIFVTEDKLSHAKLNITLKEI